MEMIIRNMCNGDRDHIFDMMRVFYASAAVFTNGSDEIFNNDIDACVGENPFAEGFVFEYSDEIIGYAMIAKSFSTEFGKACIWIEDLYFKDEFRGLGLGKQFFDFITGRYTDCIFRLEVEEENERAVRLYRKCGFSELPYMEMKK